MKPGAQLGPYKILEEIGEGGFGCVLKAKHKDIGRLVALKTLKSKRRGRPGDRKRLIQEARAANKLRHPGIVDITDLLTCPDGNIYVVMEFLDGETLKTRLTRERELGLPLTEALYLARFIACALAHVHQEGFIHRDVKPSNIMIVEDPQVPGGKRTKLIDFGITKRIVRDLNSEDFTNVHTDSKQFLGTKPYMAPEQRSEGGAVTTKSDVFAFGLVLFEMLAGRPPRERTIVPPSVCDIRSEVPPSVDKLIRNMLAVHESNRPDMESIYVELQQILDRLPSYTSVHKPEQIHDEFRLVQTVSTETNPSATSRVTTVSAELPGVDTKQQVKRPEEKAPAFSWATFFPLSGQAKTLIQSGGLALLVMVAGSFDSTPSHSRITAQSVTGTSAPSEASPIGPPIPARVEVSPLPGPPKRSDRTVAPQGKEVADRHNAGTTLRGDRVGNVTSTDETLVQKRNLRFGIRNKRATHSLEFDPNKYD